jgi:hypothetical protein
MKIDRQGSSVPPTERLPAPSAREAQETAPTAPDTRQSDRVEISALGRSKSESVEGQRDIHPVPAHQADRLDLIRDRLRSGFYASDDVQAAVARLIVARGDHRY